MIETTEEDNKDNNNEDHDDDEKEEEDENNEVSEPTCETCQTEDSTVGLVQGYLTDYNGDGIEDMVRTERDGQTYVFINIGTNQTPIYEGGVLIE